MIAVQASLSTHEYLVSWPVIKLKLEGSSQKQVIASQNLIVLVVSLSVTHLEVYAVKRLSFGMLKNSFIFMKKIWLFEMHMKVKKPLNRLFFYVSSELMSNHFDYHFLRKMLDILIEHYRYMKLFTILEMIVTFSSGTFHVVARTV